MSQKSSVPQAISFVSQVLKRDTLVVDDADIDSWQRPNIEAGHRRSPLAVSGSNILLSTKLND